jgi:hypothetical protein
MDQSKTSSTNQDLQSLLSFPGDANQANTIKIFNTDTNSFTNFSLPQQQNSQQLQQQLLATPSGDNDPLQQLFSEKPPISIPAVVENIVEETKVSDFQYYVKYPFWKLTT